ncbi:uncharacterized protein MONBRDRAFT_6315 [Monosiga brevicollis MX1]|uniref:Exostosin GT47 domain-containing protein n=1 Tax=Monosiga brevicollis TaxID=81824 RepID=A9UTH0_MONBE|nr:uncharacterized protein MONBRDRAFT_6315 [Monosiga brevicollis MX1]EDQ91244.1 predicted protein [Monosiga brevicollis MX1]|eukprot:XP_001743666.1 hypothetical protein [Monosiga brevicollis MX1]
MRRGRVVYGALAVGLAILLVVSVWQYRQRSRYFDDVAIFRSPVQERERLPAHPCWAVPVWNKCFVATADISPAPHVGDTEVDYPFDLEWYRQGLSAFQARAAERPLRIYVVSEQLPAFLTEMLPLLEAAQQRFVLISGLSDLTVPQMTLMPGFHYHSKVLGASVSAILDHPLLVQWFAQNAGLVHERLTALPIGVDLHTQSFRGQRTVQQQAEELARKRTEQLRFAFRRQEVILNMGLKGTRAQIAAALRERLGSAVLEPGRIERLALWTYYAQTQFVLSPPGVGYDCHRTWEALLMGAVPVVERRAAYDALFDQLPVIRIDNLTALPEEDLLAAWTAQAEQRFVHFDETLLLSRYWMQLILMAGLETTSERASRMM